jgi:hypothetical protein
MLIGIDWGGTKIEAIALTDTGTEIIRLREKTPRHDYEGCIRIIVDLVGQIEKGTGQTGPVGVGIPGSLEPKSRLGKGASSTWLLGRPVEHDLRAALGREIRVENDADCLAASESVDGAGAGYHVVFAVILGSGAGAGIAIGGRAHHGPNNSAGDGRWHFEYRRALHRPSTGTGTPGFLAGVRDPHSKGGSRRFERRSWRCLALESNVTQLPDHQIITTLLCHHLRSTNASIMRLPSFRRPAKWHSTIFVTSTP